MSTNYVLQVIVILFSATFIFYLLLFIQFWEFLAKKKNKEDKVNNKLKKLKSVDATVLKCYWN